MEAISKRSLSRWKVLVQSNYHSPVRGPRHRCTASYTWWTISRIKDIRTRLSDPILPLVNTVLRKNGEFACTVDFTIPSQSSCHAGVCLREPSLYTPKVCPCMHVLCKGHSSHSRYKMRGGRVQSVFQLKNF